jgi:hypothetical protein
VGAAPEHPAVVPFPPEVARERSPVLHRALRGLPVSLLEPLLTGLRRHADALVPGELQTADGGGCAVGMMLRELAGPWAEAHREALPARAPERRVGPPDATIYDSWPALTKAYPRLPHIEIIFDVTCEAVAAHGGVPEPDIPPMVGLWMAAETQAEINMRHVEEEAASAPPPELPARRVALDGALFEDTVQRLRELRPSLSRAQAAAAVEELVGARRLEPEPLFMPAAWERELELQRTRLAARA